MKGILIIWLSACFALVLAQKATPARIINCEVTVRERQPGPDENYILIEKRQFPVVEGIKNSAFIVNFTLDLTAVCNDSGIFDCQAAVFTVGPQAQTFFKNFQSQPGGVYFLNNVRSKGDVIYRVGISPVSVDSAKTSVTDCDFDFRRDGVWNFDPSAHFDFYFVPRSLADARWNQLRDYIEINYKDFNRLFELSFPGKTNYFLSPCVLPQVTWDSRMGYAIDPPRSNCFVLYSHDHNTVDPIPGYLVRIYRYMGYAPPLLAEGMASYFEFPHYYARDLRRSDQLPPLAGLLKSVDYYGLPEQTNITAAASFVKFLVDTQGWNRFNQLYQKSTDLNIADQFPAIYSKTLDELEKEWYQVLDTVTFSYGIFRYFYEREKYINHDYGMDRFISEMKRTMAGFDDSTFTLFEEGWNRYMAGDYDTARTLFGVLLKSTPTNGSNLLTYANLLIIDSRYDSARVIYNRALTIDSTLKTALFKIGETYYWQNRPDSAWDYLLRDISEDPSQLSQASSGILLGELALTKGDTAVAREYYAKAVATMEQIYQTGKTRPSHLLRLGQGHLGLAMCGEGSLGTAKSFLESALYFEAHPTRVIFVTRILRELGVIADLEGNREQAKSYYQRALAYPLQAEFEAQVRQYMETPFAGYRR